MEKFIVSARKYRPQAFDTVVGQEHITTTLKNAIRNKQLAHAFLFCGPRGVGKTTCARILAKTINCENLQPDGEACNKCASCTSFNDGISLNIHELDAASNNSVDDIRTLVEQVRFAPQAGTYKVYIIDEVHMLSSSAFNAFLKTLEEPPPYAIFILATTEKHKILPTILSRCQIFDFKRITLNDTVEHLQQICNREEIKAEKPALQLIAQKSEGCMRDALSIMDKIVSFTNGQLTYQNTLEHLNILDADYYFKMLAAMHEQDLATVLLLFDDINNKGFEGDQVLNGFAEFMRNLLVCKDKKVLSLLEVVESFRDKYAEEAKRTDASFLVSALNILNEAEIQYKASRNKRLHIELALIKLTYLHQAITLSAVNDGFDKKKLLDTVKPVSFRNLPIHPVKTSEKAEAFVETAAAEGKRQHTVNNGNTNNLRGPKLIIESIPAPQEAPGYGNDTPANPENSLNEPTNPAKGITKTRIGKLQQIRDQYASKNQQEVIQSIPLEQTLLRQYWDEYANKVKANKNPAYTSLDNARLVIIDNGTFEAQTNNNLEQKFIEGEKRLLSEFLQTAFRNRSLCFSVTVSDNPVNAEPVEKHLNKKDQFIKLVEQYPMVKELKDRLRLELDY